MKGTDSAKLETNCVTVVCVFFLGGGGGSLVVLELNGPNGGGPESLACLQMPDCVHRKSQSFSSFLYGGAGSLEDWVRVEPRLTTYAKIRQVLLENGDTLPSAV